MTDPTNITYEFPHTCPNCGAGMVREGPMEAEVERLRAELDTSSATPGLVHGLRQEVERLRAERDRLLKLIRGSRIVLAVVVDDLDEAEQAGGDE